MDGRLQRTSGAEHLPGFLAMLQLADSGFPSGRYTLSYGLETLVQTHRLGTPAEPSALAELLCDQLRLAVAPSDGVALACAHRAVGRSGELDMDLIVRADERLTAVKLAREARTTSVRTGRALLRTARAALDQPAMKGYAERVEQGRSPGNHAVVLGVLSACLDVSRMEAVAGELFAFCTSWVAAAVRLAAADHVTAQALLHQVQPVIAEASLRALDKRVSDISGCAPLLDVMAMRHEQSGLRLFAS
jgi:urease accessory protein